MFSLRCCCTQTFMFLLVVKLLVLVVNVTSLDETDVIIPVVRSVFEKKCLKNSNSTTLEAVLKSAINLRKCTAERLTPPSNNEDIINFVCKDLREADFSCLKIFTENLKPCLEPEEKYLTEFILNTRKANFDYVCRNDGNELRGLNSINVGYCQLRELTVLSDCLPNSKLVQSLSKDEYVIKKTELCTDLEDLRKCLAEGTRKQCKEDKDVAEYLARAYGTYTSMCDSDPFADNAVD